MLHTAQLPCYAAVIRVNASGDLLPNVLHDGLTTYEAQIAALTGAQLPVAQHREFMVYAAHMISTVPEQRIPR